MGIAPILWGSRPCKTSARTFLFSFSCSSGKIFLRRVVPFSRKAPKQFPFLTALYGATTINNPLQVSMISIGSAIQVTDFISPSITLLCCDPCIYLFIVKGIITLMWITGPVKKKKLLREREREGKKETTIRFIVPCKHFSFRSGFSFVEIFFGNSLRDSFICGFELAICKFFKTVDGFWNHSHHISLLNPFFCFFCPLFCFSLHFFSFFPTFLNSWFT